jgi:hypothetical protein
VERVNKAWQPTSELADLEKHLLLIRCHGDLLLLFVSLYVDVAVSLFV